MDYKHLLFSFGGRINRAKYWLFVAIAIAATLVTTIIAIAFSILIYRLEAEPEISVYHWGVVVLVLALIYPGLAVAVKRLHDRDKSGWWLLAFYLAPPILQGVGNVIGGVGHIFTLAGWALSVWALVELGFLRGTSGPNRFGPDPLEPAA